ncbi:MAG: LacI family DNA-binding transcriptional regulator [Oenococcus sp.]|uniref:LacI family DNA-binding transcriptional regulator n=1 Tax=Oenococcus TaxID=46254 RepID=UPI0021E86ABB|nr:LacI family DNA-binding transcriptional regulator [Oenococcus kitaharae]MCV3296806.1 LacI family DNA-binding transcriptional regulator [Oenococcus kitaharae]
MVTLKDIALAAGVSTATASRALNPNPVSGTYINKNTRAHVLKMAAKLGYSPNLSARTLSNGSSNTVGVVFGPNTGVIAGNDFGLHMLFGIQQAIAKFNYTSSLASGDNWNQVLDNVKLLVEGTKTKLFVLLYTMKNDPVSAYLRKKKIRYVITGEPEEWTDALYVDNDNRLAGYQAGEILLDDLHARYPLAVTSHDHWKFEINRLAGFKAKMAKSGKKFCYLETSYDPQVSKQQLVDILERNPAIDSIFATDDRLAFIAKQQYDAKFSLPVPVVSFNNSEYAAIAGDHFYSFDVLPEQLGIQAVGLLFNHNGKGTNVAAGHVVIQAKKPKV